MKKLQQIITDIYIALYKEIDVDFETVDKTEVNWFSNYFLSAEKQDEIIENCLKPKRLTRWQKQIVKNTIHLGVSPNTNMKNGN